MKLLRIHFICATLWGLGLFSPAFGLDRGSLLELSSSKNSFIFGRGLDDGLVQGEQLLLYLARIEQGRTFYKFLGRAEVIKSMQGRSFCFLRDKKKEFDLLDSNDELYYQTKSQLELGRSKALTQPEAVALGEDLALDSTDIYKSPEFLGAMEREENRDSYTEQIRKELAPVEVIERDRQKKNQKNPLWSAAMSDDQLRRFFIVSGLKEEKERQQRALDFYARHEVTLKFNKGFEHHDSLEDRENQGRFVGLGLYYEYMLKETSELLDALTVEFGIERVRDYIDVGDANSQIDGLTYQLGANWYFLHSAEKLDQYLWFLGSSVSWGKVEGSKSETYERFRFPAAHFGFKYRFSRGHEFENFFHLGFSFLAQVSYETVSFDIKSPDQTNTKNELLYNDLKFTLGMGFYF